MSTRRLPRCQLKPTVSGRSSRAPRRWRSRIYMGGTFAEKRIVVLASGGGTNLQAMIDAKTAGHLGGKIVGVVCNRKAAYALTRAEQHDIPAVYFPLKPYT